MIFGRGAGDVPALLKPRIKVFLADTAFLALAVGRLPVAAGFALHEDEFHVVLDDRVWLVGFAEELAGLVGLEDGIGNLVPDDRVQVVEAQPPAKDGDVGMKREYQMPS